MTIQTAIAEYNTTKVMNETLQQIASELFTDLPEREARRNRREATSHSKMAFETARRNLLSAIVVDIDRIASENDSELIGSEMQSMWVNGQGVWSQDKMIEMYVA